LGCWPKKSVMAMGIGCTVPWVMSMRSSARAAAAEGDQEEGGDGGRQAVHPKHGMTSIFPRHDGG
jgi:hypothetical protein